MIVLIDDLRSFLPPFDGREHVVARTSAAGLQTLRELVAAGTVITELWLDHDLGEHDDIMCVVDYLSERAANDEPVAINQVYVHTQNPAGARQMLVSLERYGYRVARMAPKDFLISE